MLNQVTLIGRLGAAPEVRQIDGGKKVASLNVATTEYYKKGDGFEELTEWHKVVVWGEAVNRIEKLEKGEMVLVEGKIKTRTWEKDGVKKYSTEIVGNVKRIGGKKKDTAGGVQDTHNAGNAPETDDLPF